MAKEKTKAAEPVGVVAAAIEAAPNFTLPDRASPQLTSLPAKPPSKGEWRYEIKYDGYSILARVEGRRARLVTRNGNDWTDKMTSLANELGKLKVKSAWIDGEAVVLNDEGLPDFNTLQNAFDRHAPRRSCSMRSMSSSSTARTSEASRSRSAARS